MRGLEEEIDLREETRQAEQVRAATPVDARQKEVGRLAQIQASLAERIGGVTNTIRGLSDGEARFPQEILLLTRVEEVMVEAEHYLKQGDTGPGSIAAETEAIELLLQTQRIKPKGGGGGGSSPGGGGSGQTDESALALLGIGDEKDARSSDRTVSHSTGKAGTQLPAEFRSGLDAFFDALEK